MTFRYAFLFLISFLFLGAQEPTPTAGGSGMGAAIDRLPGMGGGSQAPQAYDKVITKDAKSKSGVFTVHEVKDKYYYEIPKTELNREFLLVTQVSRTTLGVGYGGDQLTEHVVKWERHDNKINLREVNYELVADPKAPISLAVKAANNDSIIMTFPIAAFGREKGAKPVEPEEPPAPEAVKADAAKSADAAKPDATKPADASKPDAAKAAAVKRPEVREYKETGREPSIIIEVTRLFTSDVFELSAKQRLNATMMDSSRSYIERISPYPQNIEVEATLTYTRMATPPGASSQNPFASSGMRPGSATLVLHHSMIKLPEHPMMPRLFDERVGYFNVRQMDYSRDEHRAPKRTYITRWRLEKKDANAELSEPVKPIVYYIDAATPPKWVPYLKRGVESWQKAFEAAGFKNAIIAKMAPTPAEDPDFSPEDIRYSVIRWLPSTIENAYGPHIADPRTGEILNADIRFYHNIMNLQRDWYFLQVGPLDPRAAKLPLPDDLMGRLLEFVCAHEVGHTLGFQHNMKSSSLYPQEKVRDKEWVKKMGHTPSIMDYSRFNYVAQPEDGIDVADLVPSVGPYDVWAARWGYKPIAAKDPDAEKNTLDEWAREQDKTPWFRFSTPGSGGSDPGELTEAVGDADAIQSTAMGLKNLQRVAKMMLTATTTQKGEAYEDLSELYGRMLGQWTLEMNHVAAIVGGFDSQQKNIGQEGVLYTPVAKKRQAAAVSFLDENAFATPRWAIDKEILRRIEPLGAISRVGNAQRSVLNSLLSSARFARLVEQEALDGSAAYSPEDFLVAVRHAVWHEVDSAHPTIDAYRRQLQRNYLDIANTKINGSALAIPAGLIAAGFPMAYFASSGDEKSFYRAELRSLSSLIDAAIGRTTDREARAHLQASRDQIAKILDPRFAAPSAGGTGNMMIFADQDPSQINNCWPDYIIQP